MIDYSQTYKVLENSRLSSWMEVLPQQVNEVFTSNRWGQQPQWQKVYDQLPEIELSKIVLNSSEISLCTNQDCPEMFKNLIMELHPWRKGPFDLFGVKIDTEWRSDWKWDRLIDHIQPLTGRKVLDIGCGSGYHCLRARGAGAELVVGIEPMLKYVYQFYVLQKYIQDSSCAVFPIGIEDMPKDFPVFDTVFSMGVFYHRKSPIDHLYELKSFLEPGGQLVLETLIIDGNEGEVLVPKDRYAQMPNVWFIPSVPTLQSWLLRCGFSNVACVDVTVTTIEEQRQTDWMTFDSLSNFLDPSDMSKTREGYPSPKRAVFIATK